MTQQLLTDDEVDEILLYHRATPRATRRDLVRTVEFEVYKRVIAALDEQVEFLAKSGRTPEACTVLTHARDVARRLSIGIRQ